MKKRYIAAIGAAGLAGAYYLAAQQGSPENLHSETLTREYIDTALAQMETACRMKTPATDSAKLICAESVFETSTKFFIHWRNSMAQNLYDSIYGTIIGDESIAFKAAKLDMACRFSTGAVTAAKTLPHQMKAVSEYTEICTNVIQAQIEEMKELRDTPGRLTSWVLSPIEHEFKVNDFDRLKAHSNEMAYSYQ